MSHNIMWFDGAESDGQTMAVYYNGTEVLPAGWSVVSSLASWSVKAYKWTCASGSNEWHTPLLIGSSGAWTWPKNNGYNYYWQYYHFYIETLPTSGNYVYLGRFADASTYGQLRMSSAGKMSVYNSNGGSWSADSSGALEIEKWYTVSYQWHMNGTTKVVVRERDTGEEIINQSHGNSCTNGGCQYGLIGGSSSYGVYYFDNIIVESATTSGASSDPYLLGGAMLGVVLLKVTGQGTDDDAQMSGTYADLDEVPKDNDTTYRSRPAYNNNDPITNTIEKISDKKYWPIQSIEAFAIADSTRGTGTYTGGNTLRLRRGSNTWNYGDVSTSSTTYRTVWALRLLDPTDSTAWTVPRVEDCEIGYAPTDTQQPGYWSNCYAEALVIYNLTPPPTTDRLVAYIDDLQSFDRRLIDQNGGRVEAWAVQANKWVRFAGWTPVTGEVYPTLVDDPSVAFIEEVSWQSETEALTITTSRMDLGDVIIARAAAASAA